MTTTVPPTLHSSCETTKLTTFPMFAWLSWQLRNDIWELAIRPYDRGAHFFNAYHELGRQTTQNGADIREFTVVPALPANEPYTPGLFAVPREIGPSHRPLRLGQKFAPFPWEERIRNPSMYMIDLGLWTACRESRRAVERVYRLRYTIERRRIWPLRSIMPPGQQGRPNGDGESNSTKSGSFYVPENGNQDEKLVQRSFTVLPGRDLFILPLDSLDQFSVWSWHLRHADFYHSLHPTMAIPPGIPIRWQSDPPACPISTQLANIAFEFKQEWGKERAWDSAPYSVCFRHPNHLHPVALLLELCEGGSIFENIGTEIFCLSRESFHYSMGGIGHRRTIIWFIDYKISRTEAGDSHGISRGGDDELVFHAMDRKYTAVYSRLLGIDQRSRWDHLTDHGWRGFLGVEDRTTLLASSVEFIDELEKRVECFFQHGAVILGIDWSQLQRGTAQSLMGREVGFGVLACEYL